MWDNFAAFANRPWKGASEMDVTDWFMFIGMVIVLLVMWNIILRHIKDAV